MTTIISPNTITQVGPWLLNRDQLLELARIIEETWPVFEEIKEQVILNEVINQLAEYYNIDTYDETNERCIAIMERVRNNPFMRSEKAYKIILTDGTAISATSMTELLCDRNVKLGDISELSIKGKCANIEMQVSIEYWVGDGRLTITLNPINNMAVQSLFDELSRWCDRTKPTYLLTLWKKIAGFGIQWSIFVLLWVIIGGILVQSMPSSTDMYHRELNEHVKILLQNGLSEKEVPDAIATLLAMQSEYVPDNYEIDKTPFVQMNKKLLRFLAFTLIGTIVCLILSFSPPAICLGIGKNEKRLSRWKTWIKFATVSLPIFIISSIVSPLIYDIIKRF